MTRDDVIRSTALHIRRVGELLTQQASCLIDRAVHHDESKWSEEEWPFFEESTPKLTNLQYGSDEYKAALKAIEPATKHHYAHNTHHPEYYTDGIEGMTLLDLIEMLCDWKAASERHTTGNIIKSLEINYTRFDISIQLKQILLNTIIKSGW